MLGAPQGQGFNCISIASKPRHFQELLEIFGDRVSSNPNKSHAVLVPIEPGEGVER